MRTKTLLLTAALGAAGVATSMAQVYSQNAVGYINLSLPAGFSMIANQLIVPSYKLKDLLPSGPALATVYKFTGGVYTINSFDDLDLKWLPNEDETIDLGGGVFINLPSTTTLTFVGEVPQGTLTTPTPAGFSIRSSQVPQQANVTQLGLVGQPLDNIYKFVAGAYQIYTFDDLDLVWTPGDPAGPTINVGESFFLNKAAGGTPSWVRVFNIN